MPISYGRHRVVLRLHVSPAVGDEVEFTADIVQVGLTGAGLLVALGGLRRCTEHLEGLEGEG